MCVAFSPLFLFHVSLRLSPCGVIAKLAPQTPRQRGVGAPHLPGGPRSEGPPAGCGGALGPGRGGGRAGPPGARGSGLARVRESSTPGAAAPYLCSFSLSQETSKDVSVFKMHLF